MQVLRSGAFLAIPVALVAVLAPLPASFIDGTYAGRVYPVLQGLVTTFSNLFPVALFDVTVAAAVGALGVGWGRWLGRARRSRSFGPLAAGVVVTLLSVALVYVWFSALWGLNYARTPLEIVLPVEKSRLTPEALRALAERAVDELNAGHAAAYAAGFPEPGAVPAALASALHDVERALGRTRLTVLSRPKSTVFAPFFRASGVNGMLAPFWLETLLNPDLTPAERPAVLAHEWGHLAGFAAEHEAGFVGLTAALRADPASRYSAWLWVLFDTSGRLGRPERQEVLSRLDEGPRADRAAIIARLTTRMPRVERVSWQTYDRYLRAQGVGEGIQIYGRVVELILGLDPSHPLAWNARPGALRPEEARGPGAEARGTSRREARGPRGDI